MITMIGSKPMWTCDVCYVPMGIGLVLYTQASVKGHFPAPVVVCGERCAAKAEATVAPPVQRMDWADFEGLNLGGGDIMAIPAEQDWQTLLVAIRAFDAIAASGTPAEWQLVNEQNRAILCAHAHHDQRCLPERRSPLRFLVATTHDDLDPVEYQTDALAA